ncbi:MAG: glycosyltransferase family 4 protein [Candidatus Omnitrophica bacterium]|nr:glycosyltransferase family 4 protein [Candidatus Omnitrophota bacterium]
MKILILTTHLDMGGIPVYVVNLARGLKKRGHRPVVVSDGGWLERQLAKEKIPHHRVSMRTSSEINPRLWLKVVPQLIRILHQEKPDLVHAHTRVAQFLSWFLSMVTRIPYVTTCHGLYQFRIGRRFLPCWGKRVMAISEATMDLLVEQYKLAPPHQAVLVWNGVEVERFLEPPPPEAVARLRQAYGINGSPIIGAIARLSPVKGFDLLLGILPDLLKEFPRLQVLLTGDGPAKESLIKQAFDLGVADHVVITHPLEDTRIALALMDLAVTPSRQEGFGLTIVESMAAGVAVVATDSGGPKEIIENGKSGLLIPPGDEEALKEAVLTLLRQPERRRELAQAGRERAATKFNMERVVQEVEAVYTLSVAN